MSERLQEVNGDTVLEITETIEKKSRFSLTLLQRRKAMLEALIAKSTHALGMVNDRIAQIENAKGG